MARSDGQPKKSEVLKSNIFKRAIDLFTEKGFENVKITEICEALQISIGTFYYYYPSKEAILLEYYKLADEMADEMAAKIKSESYSERLKQLIVHKVGLFSTVGQVMGNDCMKAFLKHRDDSSMDMHRTAYLHFMHTIEEGQKAGEFRSDLDPYMLTSSLRYIVSGLALHWACSPNEMDVYAEAELQAEHFVKGIRA